jgi:hypothetical protein
MYLSLGHSIIHPKGHTSGLQSCIYSMWPSNSSIHFVPFARYPRWTGTPGRGEHNSAQDGSIFSYVPGKAR